MTRDELEKQAYPYYNKDEIKILLKGFDLGMLHAEEVVHKASIQRNY